MRKIVFVILTALFVAFAAYGLATDHFAETLLNGAMICLSCIGVG